MNHLRFPTSLVLHECCFFCKKKKEEVLCSHRCETMCAVRDTHSLSGCYTPGDVGVLVGLGCRFARLYAVFVTWWALMVV